MKRYTARAERSGKWWAISVPEVKGAHSQARRLDQVEDMARDAIAGVLDVPMRSFEVQVEVHMPVALDKAVREAIERRRSAEEAGELASESLRRAASLLVADGLTVRDAGHVLHVSHQRVGQVTSKRPSAKSTGRQSGSVRTRRSSRGAEA
jgi:predicted RNase H-like HicB family nuclease